VSSPNPSLGRASPESERASGTEPSVVPPPGEGLETGTTTGLRGLPARAKAAAGEARARAEARRESVPLIGATFDVVERDSAIGGGILAGALAYRLFFFLLPLALVAVGALGALTEATGRSAESLGEAAGMSGLVTGSVADAIEDEASWYALLAGVPILVWVSSGLVRVLAGIHRLAWGVSARGSRPSLRVTIAFTAAVLVCVAVVAFAVSALDRSGVEGLAGVLLVGAVFAAAWLALTMRLPHPGAAWTALLPGAALFGLGVQALHLFNGYFVAPLVEGKQDIYGVLGVAAALLFSLYLGGRLIVATAVLDATLWERRQPAGSASAEEGGQQ
jgi:membrane protein